MSKIVLPNHPKQKLLFYLAQDVDDSARQSIRRLIDNVAVSRDWTISPPNLVDSIDTVEEGSGDSAVATMGGELELYSALPPADLPRDVDRQHFEEVKTIVEAVRVLSAKEGLAFEFELGGTYAGSIQDGEIDRTLRIGLLDEWEKHLAG